MRLQSPLRHTLEHHSGTAIWILVVIALLNLILIYEISVYTKPDTDSLRPTVTATEQLDHRMRECVKNVLGVVDVSHPEISYYDYVWNICAHEIYTFYSYMDFDIRREKIIRKGLDERVLLLMVVTVTLSGVALAAVQLWLSYKLVSSGQGELAQPGTISLKQGELALRSSVTGLFILAFSLAFFIIYVKWIYPTQEVAIPGLEFKEIPHGTISGSGELDPIPQSAPPQKSTPERKTEPAPPAGKPRR